MIPSENFKPAPMTSNEDRRLEALKKLGMNYKLKDGYILAKSKGKLKGTIIKFPKISVGATENSIIAACLAKGKTN